MSTRRTIYFKGFDLLRFLAASLVVFGHIELVRHYRNIYSPISLFWIYESGKLAVSAFFVLSGFLITYLLISEKEKKSDIRINYFYLRRALRIWPLYYLLVIIIFFVLPLSSMAYIPGQTEELHNHFITKLFLFLLLMPQVAYAFFKPIPGSVQFWTIGTEEIFYFIWPWIIKKTNRIYEVVIALIIAYTSIKFLTSRYNDASWYHGHQMAIYKIYSILRFNRIDCILIGSLAGYLFYQKDPLFMSLISNRIVVACAVVMLIAIFALASRIGAIDYAVYSILFSVIISALALKGSAVAPALTQFLGKLSYGIYVWHFVAIFMAFNLLKAMRFLPQSGMGNTLMLYLFSYGITLVIAAISYFLYERWFLQFKNKFEK